MKKAGKILAVALGATICAGTVGMLAGCGDGGASGDETRIRFTYEAEMTVNPVFYDLIRTYNNTQGKTDGVYVSADMTSGAGNSRSTYEGACDSSVVMLDETVFKDIAIDGLFVDLTDYAKNYDFRGMPESLVNSARMTIGGKGEKTFTGEGQNLQAMPFGLEPTVLWIQREHFENWGIHFISVAEDELGAYNQTNGTHYQPHGYAEYAADSAPASGLTLSSNLAGEQVYKVFNNRISMNWEEFRYLAKCFTQTYNPSSPTPSGFVTEWWFPYAWSVGGDCIGWDGEKYNFTIADDTPNYLATKEVEVNGKTYAAGDIIAYEDKVSDSETAQKDGLAALPSTRDALTEFLRLAVDTNVAVDGAGTEGYKVMPNNYRSRLGNFTNGTIAMVCDNYNNIFDVMDSKMKDKFDFAPTWQYRRYAGGSTYQKEDKGGFENEFLKVIGKDYGGQKYTGELQVVNGTAIVGGGTVQSGANYLVIPKNSDPAKYDAAWKFISWATGVEGQKIIAEAMTPVRESVAYSEFADTYPTKNLWAVAHTAMHFDFGDWAYFQNGEWVNKWSGDFNDKLRKGSQTLTQFLSDNGIAAQRACEETNIVIKGRR